MSVSDERAAGGRAGGRRAGGRAGGRAADGGLVGMVTGSGRHVSDGQ
jgi:hypothetical protein